MASQPLIPRRRFLIGSGVAAAGAVSGSLWYQRLERFHRADVVIAKAANYDADLVDILRRGLAELGLGPKLVKGKSVLLKPNLVEPTLQAPHINTHPDLVRAAAQVFRGWSAREVFVAEGQGHCRDTQLVLEQSGMGPMLDDEKIEFADLNHDDIIEAPNALDLTGLKTLYLPASLRRADIVVSMPKLKTHHWAGVTLSMKNLFGLMPGVCYGWPKNLLHSVGIGQSILDIYRTVRPHLAIVDGIVGMEGDGPIMGDPKAAGVLVLGMNLPAVDATATRVMGLNPEQVDYLAYASGRFGPIQEPHIRQRGESIASVRQPFRLLDHPAFDHFRAGF